MRQGLLGGSAYSWCSTRSRCYRIFFNLGRNKTSRRNVVLSL